MKKLSKNLFIFMLLLCSVCLFACEEIETLDGGTKLFGANITSWYEGSDNVKYLDTSVTINFDEIDISEISKIKFELYQDDTLLGNAVSEGNNLISLLKNCANYWGKDEDTYLEVVGERILSCAFRPREESGDNGYWIRSKCTASVNSVPNGLKVTITLDDIAYETSYIK